ncbi:MAG: pyrimidine dimer glycosylase [Acidobacteria bacterium]|nr:pyrimidine dimer glycosylase [Acidobacteriota bacterium]
MVRLWSIHPRYLDPVGLVALWREALLAQAVLRGLTRGYTRHPQLIRFREHAEPEVAIGAYLRSIADEAERRGYSFDRSKIASAASVTSIEVGHGQLRFEWEHLIAKVRGRNPAWYESIASVKKPLPHPIFAIVRGSVAEWERANAARG